MVPRSSCTRLMSKIHYKLNHGVYEIRSLTTGMRYIGGSTYSVENRVRYHKTRLGQGRHHNGPFQRAFNEEGGWSAFVVTVTELPKEEVANEEVRRILYWTKRGKAYNLAGSARNKFNRPSDGTQSRKAIARCTPEWRAAVSARVKKQHAEGKFGRSTWRKSK